MNLSKVKTALFFLAVSLLIVLLPLKANASAPDFVEVAGSFENGVEGWYYYTNVSSVSRVQSFANAPAVPYHASHCLEAVFSNVSGTSWKGIRRDFTYPKDFSATPVVTLAFNAYGSPNATESYAIIRVFSGSEYKDKVLTIQPNFWNLLTLDLTGWSKKNAITGMEVWFSDNSSTAWSGRFQIDQVAFSNKILLGGFENGYNEITWQKGARISGIQSVNTMANPPQTADVGSHCLEATSISGAGNLERSVYVDLIKGIDFTDFSLISARINCYGFTGSSLINYYGKIRVYNSTYTQVYEGTLPQSIFCNQWNTISLDVSSWQYKNDIRRIEIIFVTDNSVSWEPKFQVDHVVAVPSMEASTFEGGKLNNWMAVSNVTSVLSVSSITNQPGTAAEGTYCLEVSTGSIPANQIRSIRKDFPYPQNWRGRPVVNIKFNSYGSCPGASNYYAKIKLWSNDKTIEKVFGVTPNQWQLLSFNAADWIYLSEVSAVEIQFYTDSTSSWSGKFQIDDVKTLPYGTTLWQFEDNIYEGWTFGPYVTGLNSRTPFLEAYSKGWPANLAKKVTKTFSNALDLSDTPCITGQVYVVAGAPGNKDAYYYARVTVWSNSYYTYHETKISPNFFQTIQYDISDWVNKNNVTKIDIEVWSDGPYGTYPWDMKFLVHTFNAVPSVDSTFPSFGSSDTASTDNLNDMFYRHFTAIPAPNPVNGANQTIWRDWDSMSVSFVDTDKHRVNGTDYQQGLRKSLLEVQQDAAGYVYMLNSDFWGDQAGSIGWPFPEYTQSNGNIKGYEFNDNSSNGWSQYGMLDQSFDGKHWNLYTPSSGLPFITSPDNLNMPAFQSPYIYIRMSNTTNTQNLILQFITTADQTWDNNKQVIFPVSDDGKWHTYCIPMYEIQGWTKTSTIKQFRIIPAYGMSQSGWVKIDYIRCSYDTRHPVTNSNFILGSARYFMWNMDDTAFLNQNITRMRKAMYYLRSTLGGDANNYIVNPWWGHEATPGWVNNGGVKTIYYGRGIGGNYWDLMPIGYKDLVATYYYHAALKAMADIEELIESNPSWGISSASSPYEGSTACRTRAENVRNTVLTSSTFWNNTTGRYAACVDENNNKHDYGYTWVNLEALYFGMGEDNASAGTRAKSILDWVIGSRTVAGDTSQGSDIYNFTFAPRASTLRNIDWYTFPWYAPEGLPFGGQVQDGGAVMYVSYYDIMSRLKYLGADNAWNRLSAITDWYGDVLGDGGYRWYYYKRDLTMQGGATSGGIGIDSEFTESTILPTAYLYGFLGVDAGKDGFVFAPQKPSALSYMTADNLFYMGAKTSVYFSSTDMKVTMDIPNGTRKIKFGRLAPNTQYTVYKDSTVFGQYTSDSNGCIFVTTSGTGNHEYKVNL